MRDSLMDVKENELTE